MSPEICAAERYSHHSDVWSLGCIMYELASRCVPFDARSHVELVMKIKGGRIKPLPNSYSSELWEVISWCLKVDPRSRPDMAQLLNVSQIKMSRAKLEQVNALEVAQKEITRISVDRDGLAAKLHSAQQQILELQGEVQRLREAGKKIEMEWHARATLAIDQRVSEAVDKLRQDFETEVEQRVQEKLDLHFASLPAAHGADQASDTAFHVRSSTPPAGKNASFTTTATTATTGGSSVVESDALETDLSSLSIMEPELGDSPLAQRVKPIKKPRNLFGRAKTFANCNNLDMNSASPMDVLMADPSPMPKHVAPMSIKGLSLSPRRHAAGQAVLDTTSGLRKNMFTLAAEQRLRPAVGDESSLLDEDILEDDEDVLGVPESPSRPSSGLSGKASGDPFKNITNAQQPSKRLPRPSLTRQQTMPVNFHHQQHTGATQARGRGSNLQANRKASPEKENRPPSSHISNVPTINASPKRQPVARDGRVLTPSRKAPAPPSAGNGLAKLTHAKFPSPVGLKGRTLLELQQDVVMLSPAKWDPNECGEEMPSPFLARKGRAQR
nr:g2-specific protein kinase nima [Quercus suber]